MFFDFVHFPPPPLNHWPATAKVKLVDTQLFLAVTIADFGINIMIIDDGTHFRIVVDALAAGAIDRSVGSEDKSAAVCKT